MFSIRYVGQDITEEHYTRVHRPGGSGDYLFLFFLSPMHVILDEDIEEGSPGMCILYEAGKEQDFSAIRDFRVSFIHFSASKAEISRFGIPFNQVFMPEDPEAVSRFIDEIHAEFYTKNDFYGDAMDATLRKMFVSLGRSFSEDKFTDDHTRSLYRLFLQARFTMLSNCEREWASTNMSQMVSLSRSQFYKYYEDFFGISPMADLQHARIEKAKNLLTNRENQVTEVAFRCGYASIHHFSRTFKEHTGMSPLAYVKSIESQ